MRGVFSEATGYIIQGILFSCQEEKREEMKVPGSWFQVSSSMFQVEMRNDEISRKRCAMHHPTDYLAYRLRWRCQSFRRQWDKREVGFGKLRCPKKKR